MGKNKTDITASAEKKPIWQQRRLAMVLSPLAVALAVFAMFKKFSLYPFGSRTAAWCDMNQQVVPLLCQFKDILDGKSGMFLSFKNASGMNFWGVFFFFLASPFSLLVKFVQKSDMLVFMNILIVLKMAASAFTSSLYFVRSSFMKKLDTPSIVILSFLYATSGYVMLFYQNVIWLDMMYLFPLLLLSLEKLRGGSPVWYILVMALMMAVNYYIGYMVVVFLLLLAGVYLLLAAKAENEKGGAVCRRFLLSSGCAAMFSAVVWLPSFMQYLTSGRRTSLIENLRVGDLVTDYDTVFPVVMCSSLLVLMAIGGFAARRRADMYGRLWRIMLVLLAVPIVIEPVNKMWHTGSYMSFPARYAFMTIFAAMIAAADMLGREHKYRGSMKLYAIGGLLCATAVVAFERFSSGFVSADLDILSTYTGSLGGSEASFKSMCKLFIVGAACFALIYALYRHGWIFRGIFIVFTCAAVAIESMGYIRVYMTTTAERNESTNDIQRQVFALADRVDDDDFYRMKTSGKLFDYNMIGAMGYNSIGHYTSLTEEDYMFTMKRMGYTSVWMEVGTCGGTEITDALLCAGYEISHNKQDNTVYSFNGYHINPLHDRLPLGIAAAGDVSAEIPAGLTRAQTQEYIYRQIFGGEGAVTEYQPDEGDIMQVKDGGYHCSESATLIYRVKVEGRQTLYFDCFDKLSNDLSEPIYDSFSVKVGGQNVCRSYPYSKENGVLKLGTFEDETAVIEIRCLKDVNCASLGVFGVDLDKLDEACGTAQGIGLQEKKNGLYGEADFDSAQTVFLSVPYNEGFTVKVNGEKIEYRKALSGFMAFDLPAGKCSVDISFKPQGFTAGAALSICGVAATAVYLLLRKKLHPSEKLVRTADKIGAAAAAALACIVLLAVYIMPIAVNIFMWKRE